MNRRRRFLKRSFEFIAGMGLLFSPLLSWIQLVHANIQKIILPKDTSREDLAYKNPAELDTRHLDVTPLEDFKTMGITDHQTDLDTWRLEVSGHVVEPLHLSYSEILTLPAIERDVLLICPGIFANHGRWKGISMNALLKKANVTNGGTLVTFKGPEGKYEKVEQFHLQDVLSNKVFLAYAVNGKALPQKHGFPLRVVAEGHFGFTWVKYVHKMTVD
ncbi:MAG: molybdopterin-dependent oxidoreductase [Deltaproteobacteria bacterium]|nr:molybdopterin-dependent oxidoreductase [Deltaproteobacteria bacterium]